MIAERYILTVVGKDHPGIIAGISDVLYRHECNIQDLNQTVLGDEFAMILLLQPTKEIDIDELHESLKKCSESLEVTYSLREAISVTSFVPTVSKDKIIITVIGSDKIGIIAGVTGVLADMNINIVELSAAPYAIHDVKQYAVVARVEAEGVDILKLKTALEAKAKELSVDIEVQSQEIFNAMHNI